MKTTPELAQARDSLLSYYRQWQTFTEAEGEAIRSSDWKQVEHLQAAKQKLQKFIVTAAQTLRGEAESSGVNLTAIEKEFCDLVSQLIQLETRNREEIEVRRRQAQADLALVESSRQHLRQIQRAYAPGRDAVWQSYS